MAAGAGDMKVESSGRVEGISGRGQGPGGERRRAPAREAASEGEREGVRDEVVLHGVPGSELSPKAQEALTALMGENRRLRQELDAARRRVGELEELADHDALTPVFNRRALLRELVRLVSYANRYRSPLSLIFLDVDQLKAINDEFGHKVGDRALMTVAEALIAGTRSSDIVGRLGGDEFGILLPHADAGVARETAARLAAHIAHAGFEVEGRRFPLSISYGVHTLQDGESAEDVLAAADARMYRNKEHRLSG